MIDKLQRRPTYICLQGWRKGGEKGGFPQVLFSGSESNISIKTRANRRIHITLRPDFSLRPRMVAIIPLIGDIESIMSTFNWYWCWDNYISDCRQPGKAVIIISFLEMPLLRRYTLCWCFWKTSRNRKRVDKTEIYTRKLLKNEPPGANVISVGKFKTETTLSVDQVFKVFFDAFQDNFR